MRRALVLLCLLLACLCGATPYPASRLSPYRNTQKDFTAALQNAVDAYERGTCDEVVIPDGRYTVRGTVYDGGMRYGGWLHGRAAGKCLLVSTSNAPILSNRGKDGAWDWGIRVSDISLVYEGATDATTPRRVGIAFEGWARPGEWSVYRSHFERIVIENPYVGIGILPTDPSSPSPVWRCAFDGIVVKNAWLHAIDLGEGKANGQPSNEFRSLEILGGGQGGQEAIRLCAAAGTLSGR